MESVKVGMADLKVIKGTGSLITLGLGSCVGIALYDKKIKVAGLAHIMLPSSLEIKNNKNKAKFANTAIEILLKDMERLGSNRKDIVAKLAGGAQMFNFNSNQDILKIGKRNVIASKNKLIESKIKVISEDTGGNFGRTIELKVEDGQLIVKTIGHGIKII